MSDGHVKVALRASGAADYDRFLAIRRLPRYRIEGDFAYIPGEYAEAIGVELPERAISDYTPPDFAFDYQADIARLAIQKRHFAVFADCGLGKTIIGLEFTRHAVRSGCKTLIVAPLMVVNSIVDEADRFYGDAPEIVPAASLQDWLDGDGQFGITNYDAIREGLRPGKLGALWLDESSMLKSHYGAWGLRLIELGRQCEFKLCSTGTPAPNDRIEYANHAVFLNVHRTTNEFLAKYFVNRGQTDNRWELRPHALRPFYRDLSDWCIFLTNPATYGWRDNCGNIPPINVHIHHVELTPEQMAAVRAETGQMVVTSLGGIGSRSVLSRISKGVYNGEAIPENKSGTIKALVDSWPDESTIIWCRFNSEQDHVASLFPDAANIDGSTPHDKRLRLLAEFKGGERRVLISKPKVLGFGLNLQVATRHIFSAMDDSYEEYYQAVKRSNRVGSTKPLNVHIPVTEIEELMVQNVLRKAGRVDADTRVQESLFKEVGYGFA